MLQKFKSLVKGDLNSLQTAEDVKILGKFNLNEPGSIGNERGILLSPLISRTEALPLEVSCGAVIILQQRMQSVYSKFHRLRFVSNINNFYTITRFEVTIPF